MKEKIEYLTELKNNPQKFKAGDLVSVRTIDFFNKQIVVHAIVIGSYADQFGANDDIKKHRAYTLFPSPKHCVKSSWYDESELTLLSENKLHLIKEWEEEKEKQNALLNRSLYQWFDDHKELEIKRVNGTVIISIMKTNCVVSENNFLARALQSAREIIGE